MWYISLAGTKPLAARPAETPAVFVMGSFRTHIYETGCFLLLRIAGLPSPPCPVPER